MYHIYYQIVALINYYCFALEFKRMQQFNPDFFSCLEYNIFSKKLRTLLGILRRLLGKGSSIEIKNVENNHHQNPQHQATFKIQNVEII